MIFALSKTWPSEALGLGLGAGALPMIFNCIVFPL